MSETEEKIKMYATKAYHMKREDVDKVQLPRLLSLIEMKSKRKYNEFKLKLRKDGWII